MKKIEIRRYKDKASLFTLVDDEDFEWLNRFKWQISSHGYVKTETGRGRMLYMHRLINKTQEEFVTDHINRNKLDNRRENLRTVNKSENGINRLKQINNTSGYKGISWDRKASRWEAFIHLHRKKHFLGYFKDIKDAIMARRQGELKYHAI
jgi:hypothetical protein